jgi:hypothetical protein
MPFAVSIGVERLTGDVSVRDGPGELDVAAADASYNTNVPIQTAKRTKRYRLIERPPEVERVGAVLTPGHVTVRVADHACRHPCMPDGRPLERRDAMRPIGLEPVRRRCHLIQVSQFPKLRCHTH